VNVDSLFSSGWKVFANKICTDWKLAVPTIHQNRKFYGTWSTKIVQSIKGGSDGSSAEQHVIDQNYDLVIDPLAWDERFGDWSGWVSGQIVAVHRDVQATEHLRDIRAWFIASDDLSDSLSKQDTARWNAEDYEI
jgi:hypothetical protein